jgi:prolyl 4-hydroxylase
MDAQALFEEAAARLRANRVAEARDLFGRAGAAGHREAAVIHCNLVASGGDWARGIALLRALAEVSARCRRELAIVEAIDPDAPIPVGRVLSETPHLTLFESLFTAAECDYLAEAAAPMLAPSTRSIAGSRRRAGPA